MDQILRQCSRGNAANARTSAFRLVHQGADLGVPGGELVTDLVPLFGHRAEVRLGEDRAEHRRNHLGLALGHMR